ncbi:hypothetical protein DW934_04130 [Blautia obeum]|jgi:5-methylcytosine-specific restriction endonuclease McrA|uniref:hypothetical protein n=1 Tax=Blautia obeum TaxID=40520 RepID=UPI000E5074E5|nr:hypothetical protein [Blautia obeum]RHA50157.1 hypothetical protein DW934_04130 [Blautia obeum]
MNQLSEPNINNEDVFIAVAKSKKFQNGHCEKCNEATPDCETCTYGNRGKMLALKEWVFERYNFYTQNKNNLNAIKPIDIMREDEKDLLEKSYQSSNIFQEVKRQLLKNIPEGRTGMCPFCMISEPTTFDHYFSESEYPEYIIFAPNLVPCCSQCNSIKGNRLFSENQRERKIIHFYYDNLPQMQYLKAVFKVNNKIPQVSFSLEFENESEITAIIENHFDTLHLLERYKRQSNDVVSTECEIIRNQLKSGGTVEECAKILKIRANVFQKVNGLNYWKTCIYMAMSKSEEQLAKLI